jgi:hypothetical protein
VKNISWGNQLRQINWFGSLKLGKLILN